MIRELNKKLIKEEILATELFEKAKEKALKHQKKYNCFVTINEKFKQKESNSLLNGIPYSLKDNISTSGILTTASSNILKDYVPVYDATVYQKLKKSGAVLMGKAVLDELAMGGTGTTGHTGIVCNPYDEKRIVGGSSAGSVASVALGITPFSIGSDTGDSIRKPAAYTGLVGFKPTYGRVSRYGLFAFASSLDHVGCITTCVEDAAIVTDIIKGECKFDMTTLSNDGKAYVDTLNKDVNGKKLFYIKEICDRDCDKETEKVLNNFFEVIEKCQDLGIKVVEESIDTDLLKAIYPAYMAISCAEATSNNANLLGVSFGTREKGDTIEEMIFNSRTKGFSELIKRRFILGSYILQKENQEKLFLNAGRVRRLIVDKINELFKEYDGFILPAAGSVAPKIDAISNKIDDKKMMLENNLIIGNFGGFPSITIPSGKIDNLPVGVNITSKAGADDVVLNIAYQLEKGLGDLNV